MEELILSLISKDFLIIVAVCYALGMFIKSTTFLDDKFIPITLLFVSIVIAIIYNGIIISGSFTYAAILYGIIQGILCAAVAVFFNQLIKQTKA